MPDQTNDNTQSEALDTRSKEQQIEDMIVSAGAARGELPALPKTSGHPGMRVTLIPDQEPVAEYLDAEQAKLAEVQAAQPEGDLPDDGRDLNADLEKLAAKVKEYHAAFYAVKYDPRTGEPSPLHSPEDRERFQLLAEQAYVDLDYEAQRAAKIGAQRERKAAAKEEQARAELEREEWLNREAIRRADELEIDRRAAAIMQQRRGRG